MLESELCDIVRGTPWFMRALTVVQGAALPNWCIGAGALRDAVWDARSDAPTSPLPPDIDVAYFDPADISRARDIALQSDLEQTAPELPWEVTNQAGVHLWFHEFFGNTVAPLRSLEEAVASWPETATAVAVTLDQGDRLRVIAPLGLEDLMKMVVRRNSARVSITTYRDRLVRKGYTNRWPRVQVFWE